MLPASTDASTERRRSAELSDRSQVTKVFLGLLAPVAVASSFFLLFVAPPWLSYPTCAALYALMLLAERRSGILGPQSIALFVIWAAGAAVVPFLPDRNVLQRHEAVAILATLSVLSIARFAWRRSRVGDYGGAWGPRRLHDTTMAVWLAISLSGSAIGLATSAGSSALATLPVLVFAGTVATLAVNLVGFGPAYWRQQTFALGRFTFRQLPADAASIDKFLQFFSGEIWEAVNRDRRTRTRYSREEILSQARHTEQQAAGARRFYFVALNEDRIVGTVAVALDGAHRRLPVETSFGVTFDPLRQFGRVMEVRRLCVEKNHRFNEEVLRGLLKCAIEVGLEKDVAFFVDFTFGFVTALLQKVGFDVIDPHDREVCEFGAPMRLLGINFARRQLSLPALDKTQEALREIVNPYLRYRYVQRAALRQWWRSERRCVFSLSIDQIKSLCLPTRVAVR